MKIKIPKKFRLGPYDIKVKMFQKAVDSDERMGTYHKYDQLLRLDEGLPDETLQEIFIHELLEAITQHYEIEMKHADMTTIGMTLAQIIRDLKGF